MVDLAKDNEVNPAPKTIYLKDYQPPLYQVVTLDLKFELDAHDTLVSSQLVLERDRNHPSSDRSILLHGQNLELKSVRIDGQELDEDRYQLGEDGLTLLEVPDRANVEIQTVIHPEKNTALEGLYVSNDMFCTQCEAEGFRRITYFPDRPDVMTRFTTTIVANKTRYPQLLSNGNPVKQGELDNGRHWVTWEDPFPKPSYLFALVAGDLHCQQDHFTTGSGREVQLMIYVERENRDKCDHALASLKQAMTWDEDTWGREYDLDIYMIVAVNDFNMGAMENKGLNVFNASCVLASPETATDADYYNIQSIIGHEYFHNWSGNRVTCRDWFQLSLKEGFTVFRDQEFSADLNSRPVKRIADVNVLRSHQFAQDSSPMAHPVRPDAFMEISNFYTVTIYNKGAEVVRMISNLVGTEGFRKGTDLYFERHDGQAVTTDDLVAAMEDANQVDLRQFKRWYDQAGTPQIRVQESYDAARQQYFLTLQQHCPPTPGQKHKEAFHIPIDVALLDQSGQAIPLQLDNENTVSGTSRMLELREVEQQFVFNRVEHKPVLSLLRHFSAPVKIEQELSNEDLAFLLANDPDPFNRWDAGQTLAINIILALVERVQAGQTLSLDEQFIEAVRATLQNDALDPALTAQAITLPSESYLADQCDIVDVDAIHAAREFVRTTLGERLYDVFKALYRQHHSDQPYRFHAVDMGKRTLKNLCLAYLLETRRGEARNLCLTQMETSNNMTDTLSALTSLSQFKWPERDEYLDRFYNQWEHDPQVINKWFAIQAGSRLPDTLQRVQQLLQHPSFRMTNPNKVRALIGRFCQGNQIRFHAASGEGYRFLADRVLELDRINPQMAARLTSALIRWKRFDQQRQTRMRAELERVLGTSDISRDVYEIASKSLQT